METWSWVIILTWSIRSFNKFREHHVNTIGDKETKCNLAGIIEILATQSVVHELASTGSLLEMQILRPYPDLLNQSAFPQAPRVIHTCIKV